MRNSEYSKILSQSVSDQEAAKKSSEIVENFVIERLYNFLSIGEAVVSKRAGERIQNNDTKVKQIIGSEFFWLSATSLKIAKLTNETVAFEAITESSRRPFELPISDFSLSTWDYTKKIRSSMKTFKDNKSAAESRAKQKEITRLQNQVAAAQLALTQAINAAKERGVTVL